MYEDYMQDFFYYPMNNYQNTYDQNPEFYQYGYDFNRNQYGYDYVCKPDQTADFPLCLWFNDYIHTDCADNDEEAAEEDRDDRIPEIS